MPPNQHQLASTTGTMIQITNMPRVVIRNDQPTPTTPVDVGDDDHDEDGSSIVSGDHNKPNATSSSQTTTSTSSQSNVEDHPQQHLQDCFRRTNSSPLPPSVKVATSSSSSSLSLILPERYDSSLEILQRLSSGSMQAITKSKSADPDYDETFRAAVNSEEQSSQIPCRNLTEQFEELYSKPTDAMTSNRSESEPPLVKQHAPMAIDTKAQQVVASMISPTAVADINISSSAAPSKRVTPMNKDDGIVGKLDDKLGFHLHPFLQRELSDAVVQRVSFYAIIHDINKEAMSMAANDDSGYNRTPDEVSEENDPLVFAVRGTPQQPIQGGTSSMVTCALIDEEQWLLEAIEARSLDETRNTDRACPPTFPQAMGERDYENPLTSLSSGSRTQLWKPSRSWWEAKSGKNPWIEPMCHNKRWRYLWPLIHYHKFLAKCIKKLKRNGVDVKTSISPVAVFLREEVCAVSDHLAAVSLFDSDEWMACLVHFNGWTESNETAKKHYRGLVAKLKLRSLSEPGDVESTLLRNQIDEHYLRAMANARAQLTGSDVLSQEERPPKDPMRRRDSAVKSMHPAFRMPIGVSSASRPASTPGYKNQLAIAASPRMPHRHWHGYAHHPAWWQTGWHPSAYPYPDDGSVQSALSGETSYSQGYMNGYYPGSVPPGFYPHMMYSQHHMMHGSHHASYELGSIPDGSMYSPAESYNPQHMTPSGWMGHPHMGYPIHHAVAETPAVPATPARDVSESETAPTPSGEEQFDPHRTPFKYSPSHIHAMSPYWGHLDPMMGLATPQGPSAPATPQHGKDLALGSEEGSEEDVKNVTSAQPLLLRQHYYGYSQYNPPSPASQFLMTPQEPASMGYSYTYGSPQRRPARRKPSTSVNDARNDVSEGGKTTSENHTPLRPSKQSRESPSDPEGIVS